jgi:hypothetical protein
MRIPVQYRPGVLVCRYSYKGSDGRWHRDPQSAIDELAECPSWIIAGEDGTTYLLFREVDELVASVYTPGGRGGVAYGDGPGADGPIVSRGNSEREPSALQIRVINQALVPFATTRPWPDLLAECTPCDHTDEHCVRNPTHPRAGLIRTPTP